MEVPAITLSDVHPDCSDLLFTVWPNTDKDADPRFPFKVGVQEFLDDSKKVTPLLKLNSLPILFERIRVSPERLIGNEDAKIRSHGASLLLVLIGSCEEVMKATKCQSFCHHCLFHNYYRSWKALFPDIASLSLSALIDLLNHRQFLLNYEAALRYYDICSIPVEDDNLGVNKWIIGRKEFCSLGVISIDRSIWKIFWLAVRRVYPVLEKSLDFDLSIKAVVDKIDAFQISMKYCLTSGKFFTRHVVIPRYGNIWAAICFLFDHAPPNVATINTSPFHYLDKVPAM
jgi:hypothetical protein